MCKGNCNCISDILKVICLLQKNADCEDFCIESCDKPTLGLLSNVYYNTRPVMLYTCQSNGTEPWRMPTSRVVDPEETSSIFRIEKIDGCCATFRVLTANDDGTYNATDSFFTINLECICALRCLNDTLIDSI